MGKAKKVVKAWLKEVLADGSWERANDLHINEIKKKYDDYENYIEGSIKYLVYAHDELKKLDNRFTVDAQISLRAVRRPIGFDFKNIHELSWEYDFTPPSLYVFKKGKEYDVWLNSGTEIVLEDLPSNIKCTYFEHIHPKDIDYRRYIVLTLKNVSRET